MAKSFGFDGTNRIIVQDNAFGFSAKDFDRAFSPAAQPKNRHDLNEFGQGMKAACTWMADKWSVSTRTPNSPVQRSVEVDVENLSKNRVNRFPTRRQFTRSGYARRNSILPLGRILRLGGV